MRHFHTKNPKKAKNPKFYKTFDNFTVYIVFVCKWRISVEMTYVRGTDRFFELKRSSCGTDEFKVQLETEGYSLKLLIFGVDFFGSMNIYFKAFSSHLLFSHVLWTLFKKGCSQLEQGLPLTVVDIVPVYTVGNFSGVLGDQQFSDLKGESFSNGLWQMATPLFCRLN